MYYVILLQQQQKLSYFFFYQEKSWDEFIFELSLTLHKGLTAGWSFLNYFSFFNHIFVFEFKLFI